MALDFRICPVLGTNDFVHSMQGFNFVSGKDAVVKRPAVLVSPIDSFKEANRIRELKNNDVNPFFLMADSGGFAVERHPWLHPKLAAQWQRDTGADIVIILDYPPFSVKVSGGKTVRTFRKSMVQSSLDRTRVGVEQLKRIITEQEIYGVVHGNNLEGISNWYENLKDYAFDGWATGVTPQGNPVDMTRKLLFLYSKGVRNIHIFAFVGDKGLLLLVWLVKFLKDLRRVTVDSTFAVQYGTRKRYVLFSYDDSVGPSFKVFGYMKGNLSEGAFDNCLCPVCTKFGREAWSNDSGWPRPLYLFSLHTWWQFDKYVSWLMEKSEEQLRRYLTGGRRFGWSKLADKVVRLLVAEGPTERALVQLDEMLVNKKGYFKETQTLDSFVRGG